MVGKFLCYNILYMLQISKLWTKKSKDIRQKKDKKTIPAVLRVLFSFLIAMFLAFVFTWYIYYRQFENNNDEALAFIEDKYLVFWYTYVLVLVLIVLAMSIFWRTFFGAGLVFALLAILAYANEQKLLVRRAPIIPEDLAMAEQAGNLMQFVDFGEVLLLALGVICLLIGTWLLDYYCRKVIGKNTEKMNWVERHAIPQRATFTMLTTAVFIILFTPMLRQQGDTVEEVEWLETTLSAWSPIHTYNDNGLLLSFLYSFGSTQLQEPEDYSKAKIAEIYHKYANRQAETEQKPTLDEQIENLVVILDESFYDPEILGEHYAHLGGDVVPNLHEIFAKYPSGYMYSPEYGGGTANVEYAIHTGLSNYWAQSVAYSSFVARLKKMPGVVSYVKQNDFQPTAVHAFDGAMYKRNIVYDRMGYETFLDQSTMKYNERENNNENAYISDRAVYDQIYDLLTKNNGPQFVGASTMQNHTPYDIAGYPDRNFPLLNPVTDQAMVEASFESLHHADRYLGDFIKRLDELDEKTMVIWYGDHASGVLADYVGSEDKDIANLAHLTPYFIYTNFEIEAPFTEEEVAQVNELAGFSFETLGVDLPTVTPNCIMNLAYNMLDVQKPVLNYLLDEVCAEAPILAPAYLGSEVPEMFEALEDYKLINYDISNGKRYWLELDVD